MKPLIIYITNGEVRVLIFVDSKAGTKKKKKKSKVEVQEAEDVKKLPDEIIPSNRPGGI